MYDEAPETDEIDRRALVSQMRPKAPVAAPVAAAPQAEAPAAAAAEPTKYNTRLMEGNTDKLADPNHALKSPKYAFLQAMQGGKYNYDQLGNAVTDLQNDPRAEVASQWQGWTADGKGNLVYGGDPAKLDSRWNGVKRVDAVGGYGDFANGKEAGGFRWGVEDPNAPQGGGPAGPMPGAMGGGESAFGNIQALMPTDTNYYNTLQEKLKQLLGGDQAIDRNALIAQMSR